jgi:hypothetical protein
MSLVACTRRRSSHLPLLQVSNQERRVLTISRRLLLVRQNHPIILGNVSHEDEPVASEGKCKWQGQNYPSPIQKEPLGKAFSIVQGWAICLSQLPEHFSVGMASLQQ